MSAALSVAISTHEPLLASPSEVSPVLSDVEITPSLAYTTYQTPLEMDGAVPVPETSFSAFLVLAGLLLMLRRRTA